MKQILSKCFSKMKCVALTLFAALCVGSVWGASAELENSNARIEDGDFKFTTLITQIGSTSTRYGYLDAEVLNANDEVVISSTRLIDGQKFANKDTSTYQQSFDCVFEGVGTTTECFTIQEFYDKGYCVKLTFNGTKKTSYTELDCPGHGEIVIWRDTGVNSSEMKFAESSSIVDGKLVAPSYPYVSGEYDTTKGITKIVIRYSINDKLFANAVTKEATLNNSDGTYRCEIPAEYASDIINWEVIVYAGAESVVYYRDPGTALQKQSAVMQEDNLEFTWLGTVDNKWDSLGNWSWTGRSGCGYPGKKAYSYYVTKAKFTKNAEVDLNSGAYYLWDNNRGFEMTEGITVKLKNGTLGFQPHNDGSRATLNFGKANSTLILNNVTMPYMPSKADTWYSLKPVDSSTVVVEGTKNYYWRFNPGNINTKFKVMDGTVQSGYTAATPGSGSQLEIENGVYIVKADAESGLAATTTFRDGPDRQARLWLRNSSSGSTYYKFKLYGKYNIKIPASPYTSAYIACSYISAVDNNAQFVLDVTDYKGGERVLLLSQPSAGDGTNTRMEDFLAKSSSLVIKVNGQTVENSTRNARLVWDYSEKKLYYQQDSLNAAKIGNTEYATLGAALEAAADGATIKVLNNVEITSYLQITKSLTLDLNGKSITRTDSTDNSTALFVNAADAIVTITGDGTVTADHAVYVNAGKVVIENGTFSAGTHAVYVINNGNAEIKGGTFSSEDGQYHYVLNEYDQTRDATSIVVTGGTFVGFNPANNGAEGENTNFCALDYEAVAGDVDGTWVVQKAISELKPGIPVTNISATTEEEAINKVELKVEVPENANITKDEYAEYFKIVATETSEGSGVWEVAVVLDDTKVKPVIAETTADDTTKEAFVIDDDGNVTLNISNKKPGLYYGVQVLAELGADPVAVVPETEAGALVVTADDIPDGNAAFFKVVVDFKPIVAE